MIIIKNVDLAFYAKFYDKDILFSILFSLHQVFLFGCVMTAFSAFLMITLARVK